MRLRRVLSCAAVVLLSVSAANLFGGPCYKCKWIEGCLHICAQNLSTGYRGCRAGGCGCVMNDPSCIMTFALSPDLKPTIVTAAMLQKHCRPPVPVGHPDDRETR